MVSEKEVHFKSRKAGSGSPEMVRLGVGLRKQGHSAITPGFHQGSLKIKRKFRGNYNMKKKLAAAILASMTLALAAPAFAAPNAFADVPKNHWAYNAVNELAAAGVIDGYGDGTFKGDKLITRYEMAQIVARAYNNYDTANTKNKATMDKLAQEFGDELKNLGIRVAKLEKNQPKIKVTGETRFHYENHDADAYDLHGDDAFKWRQRLILNADINDKISYTARLEAKGTLDGGDDVADRDLKFNRNFITVKDFIGVDKIMLGKQGAYAGKNMNVGKSGDNDGVALVHEAGNLTFTGFVFSEKNDDIQFNGIYAGTNLGKNADLEIGYTKADGNDSKSFDIGAAMQFGNGFSLVGEFVDTSNDRGAIEDGRAYAVQLTKGVKTNKILSTFAGGNVVDKAKEHTDGFILGYRKIEKNSLALGGGGSIYSGSAAHSNLDSNDVKGWLLAYQNVVAKNTVLSLEYQDLKTESTGAELDKSLIGSIQLWF